MGGYVTRYGDQRLDYLTIRGSGHMVPQMKPAAAYEFMRTWVAGEEYKPYVKDCKKPPVIQRKEALFTVPAAAGGRGVVRPGVRTFQSS